MVLSAILCSACATVQLPKLDLDGQYSLNNKVGQFYKYMDNENFEAMWAMLGDEQKADHDHDEYIRRVTMVLADSEVKLQSLNIVDFDFETSLAVVMGNVYYALNKKQAPSPFFLCELSVWYYTGKDWRMVDEGRNCDYELPKRDVLEHFYEVNKK